RRSVLLGRRGGGLEQRAEQLMGDADVGDVDVEAQGRHRRTRARLTDDDRARPSRTFAGQDSGIADDVVLGAVEDVLEQEVRRRGAHGGPVTPPAMAYTELSRFVRSWTTTSQPSPRARASGWLMPAKRSRAPRTSAGSG